MTITSLLLPNQTERATCVQKSTYTVLFLAFHNLLCGEEKQMARNVVVGVEINWECNDWYVDKL